MSVRVYHETLSSTKNFPRVEDPVLTCCLYHNIAALVNDGPVTLVIDSDVDLSPKVTPTE